MRGKDAALAVAVRMALDAVMKREFMLPGSVNYRGRMQKSFGGRTPSGSHKPHQGKAECARRKKQLEQGIIK